MVEYLNKLTPEELQKFEKFLLSVYFNSNKNLIKLLDLIKPHYPNVRNEDLIRLKIYQKIFPDKDVNYVKLRKLISDFTISLEKFLTQVGMEEDDVRNRIALLTLLRKKRMNKRFEMEIKDLFKIQKNKFSKDAEYYLNQILLEDEYFQYNYSEFKLEFAECLQKRSDLLDYYFIFSKLHTFHEMVFNEISKSKTFKKNYFDEIIAYVESNRKKIYSGHPNIFIIYLVIMLKNTMKDNYLKELVDYLKKNEKKFTRKNLSYYYYYVLEYYIVKLNSGQTEYRKSAFECIRLMKEKKLFLIDDVITDTEYNNVINIVLPLKKYAWLSDFIEEYKEYLDPSFSKDAYNLGKAKLLYDKKDYDKVFQHLNEVEFKDPNYYYNSKFIMGRVSYEMRNITGLQYIITNLRQYLRVKENLVPQQVSAIKTFNNYMTDLIKILDSHPSEKKTLKLILKKELDNNRTIVPNKNWFYEKIDEP